MTKIFEVLPLKVKQVNIWSDGPSSQFKNRYIAAAIPILQQKYTERIFWNYFATLGKDAVDGIGGSIKHQVSQFVNAHKGTVFNATQFKAAAQSMAEKV